MVGVGPCWARRLVSPRRGAARAVRKLGALSQCLEDLEDFRLEGRKISYKREPHLGYLNAEISMDELVSHAGDVLPGYVGTRLTQFGREPLRSLPNDLYLPYYRVLNESIR